MRRAAPLLLLAALACAGEPETDEAEPVAPGVGAEAVTEPEPELEPEPEPASTVVECTRGDAITIAQATAPIPPPPDVAEPPPEAEKTPSGLASMVLRPGCGTAHPSETDSVTVHYTGWTTGGQMFDSSVTRGDPATFPLNRVIDGWTEGLQLMVEGEKRRFWIPADLAYGNNPRPGAPQGMLVFDVDLIAIGP